MEKVKQVVDKVVHPKGHATDTHTTHPTTTTGHHDTGLTGTHAGTHTGNTGLTGTHAGTHTGNTGVTGSSTTTAGPHSSNLMNKLDPTVDSDRDGGRNMGMAQHGPGAHTTGHTTDGLTGAAHGNTTAGHHSSDMANRADPRIDSDLDNSRTVGNTGYGASTTTPHAGLGHSTHNTSNQGPVHGNKLMNQLDPRVDSDADGSRNMGMAQQSTYGAPSHTTGASTGYGNNTTHGSGLTGSSTGSANNGPHKSSMLNKLDPRVDSDADGSRNMGAAQTSAGYPPTQQY